MLASTNGTMPAARLWQRWARTGLMCLTVAWLAACGGGGGGNSTPTPPTITTPPAAITADVGQTATFTVVAAGDAPLSYQWQRDGVDIPGATTASYTSAPVTLGDNGASFRVVVSNSAGSVTSTAALLTARDALPPVIVVQPLGSSVVAPATATFTVQADGGAPLSYQWQRNGVDVAGATAASYTTPATSLGDDGTVYTVVVSNAVGSVTSDEAALNVTAALVAPAIATDPSPVTVDAGEPAEFSVVATGSAPLSYQWQRNGIDIAGATAPTYRLTATADADNGARFRVVVNNATASPVTSGEATLTVVPAITPPSITTQPQAASVTVGATATFSVAANGTAPLSYQWQRNGSPIAGATAASYTTPVTTLADDGALYRVIVSNGSPTTVTSDAVRLTVTAAVEPPSIVTQPVAASVSVGQAASFTVGATGSAPLHYQWRRNGTAIPGANAATYRLDSATLADDGALFDVIVSNAHATSASSTPVRLTVMDEWVGIREDGTAHTDSGRGIASDSEGNVIIVGHSNGSLTSPTTNVANTTFIAKYSRSGALLWTRAVTETGRLAADPDSASVAIDNSGNIYVAGDTRIAFPGQVQQGGIDAYVVKYSPDGDMLWVRQFGSTSYDVATGIAVDAAGNAFVVGYSRGQLPEQSTPSTTQDFFIAKFNTQGERQWIRQSGSSSQGDTAYGVAVDAAGNVYMTGAINGDYAGSPKINGYLDAYAMKYDTHGNRVWFTRIGGASHDTGWSIAVSADGSRIYVGGETNSNFDAAGQPSMGILCCAYDDAFVARLDGNGTLAWVRNLPPAPADGKQTLFRDVAQSVVTDAAGSAVFVTGHTMGTLPGTTTFGARDIFVARYEADGTRTWVRQFGGGAPTLSSTITDGGWGITLDRDGNLFATGDAMGSFGTPNPDTRRPDWFVFKLRPADGSLF